jgi:hypothetical protein
VVRIRNEGIAIEAIPKIRPSTPRPNVTHRGQPSTSMQRPSTKNMTESRIMVNPQ